jgi:Domain of unknown function (DUF4384)
MMRECLVGLAFAASLAWPQGMTAQGRYRMEILLERRDGDTWRTIDPGLVLAQGDRVRFRFRANFDGFLDVMNLNSSGDYQQLFPTAEAGEDNQIASGKDYRVPETTGAFLVSGPPGYERVYWLVTPARIGAPPRTESARPVPPNFQSPSPPKVTPRCDDSIWRARGDCIDPSAGPKLVPRGADLPQALAEAEGQSRRDLSFLRQDQKTVISGAGPLTRPVIYEFRLAHR